jgi:hypothetical protein
MPFQKLHTEQAEHNLSASKYLVENSDFFDWSATTSFYSAVHYVESALSYLYEKNQSLKYFDQDVKIQHSDDLAANEAYPSYSGKPLYSPHKVRRELVEKNFVNINNSYELLFSASWFQRYTNWKSNDQSKCKRLIEKHLLSIKDWHNKLTITEATSPPSPSK